MPLPVHSRPRHMKGVVVAGAVKALRRWRRARGGTGPAALSPEARTLLEGHSVMLSTWYPYPAYLELMHVIADDVLGGDLDALADFAAAGAPEVYAGAHRTLMQEGNPAATLRGIRSLWRLCHDFGAPSAEVGDDWAVVSIDGALPMSELEGHINLGWIGGILTVAGAKALHREIVDAPWQGAPRLVLRYAWS